MLNILWIEDEYSEQKQQKWFKDRNVTVRTSFDAAEQTINSELNRYDIVVLDINIENSEQSENVKKYANHFGFDDVREFLKASGMNLYFMLLEYGFPKDRIVFLTANANETTSQINDLRQAFNSGDDSEVDKLIKVITAGFCDEEKIKTCSFFDKDEFNEDDFNSLVDYLSSCFSGLNNSQQKNTYEILQETARSCRIEIPRAFNKNTNQLDIELTEFESDYLVLRRGVIDGCNYLRNKQPRFSLYSNKDKISGFDLLSYMDILSDFFSLTESDNLSHQYKLFVRTLAHEWDDAVRPQKIKVDDRKAHSQASWAFSWIMKMTRNWSAHSKVFEGLSAQDVAFLFIVNMRAMFELGSELAPYEKYLLNLFESPLEVEAFKSIYGMDFKYKRKFGNYFEERKIPLIQSYAAMLDKYDNKFEAISFHDLLNEVQKKSSESNQFLIKGLYQVFWFLTSPGNVYIDQHKIHEQKYLNYQFSYFDYGAEVYLTEIGRHIYPRSFPEA